MKGSMDEILRFVEQNDAFSCAGWASVRKTYAATKYPTRISLYRVLKRYCCRRMPGASMR